MEKMTEKQTHGSRLPSLTNRWLKVNDTETEFREVEGKPYAGLEKAGDITGYQEKITEAPFSLEETSYGSAGEKQFRGISRALKDQLAQHANLKDALSLREGEVAEFTLGLSHDDPVLLDLHYVTAPVGHCGAVLYRLVSKDDTAGYRNGTIAIKVEEDAEIQLILVQQLNEQSVNNLSILADIADGGTLHITQVDLGGKRANSNVDVNLIGFESKLTAYASYITQHEQKLDLFYNVRHRGPYSQAEVQANGAVGGKSQKSFRGTLDFLKGSYGSKGDEESLAILMSDEAKSIDVPLLLAHEDNVEGNHAASAGRMDEGILFYLMSRGLSRQEAESLVVEARMQPTLERISDADLRTALKKEIHERMMSDDRQK